MNDTILVQRDGDIATVVLNRPEKLNALTKPMWQRLGDVFLELDADDSVRCILLRGAGEKAFAPGKPLTLVLNHKDGSKDTILVNHTYNAQQIEWFKAGGALNIIRAQQKG